MIRSSGSSRPVCDPCLGEGLPNSCDQNVNLVVKNRKKRRASIWLGPQLPCRMSRAHGDSRFHLALREMVETVDIPVALCRQEKRRCTVVGNACESPQTAVVRPDRRHFVEQRPSLCRSGEDPVVAPVEPGVDGDVERAAAVGERGDFRETRLGDETGATVSSGVGPKIGLWRALDQVARRIPVGSTPAYTDQTPPISCAPNDRTSVTSEGSGKLSAGEKDFAPSSSDCSSLWPSSVATVMSREWPRPMPWSRGIGNDAIESSTRSPWVCSNTFHGALAEFFTNIWPYAREPGYSHWSVEAKSRAPWATRTSVSVSWATGLAGSVVSG